jgi:GNAT superfamily N-acetyltransferase
MIFIEEWEANHPRWYEMSELVDQLNQTAWINFTADWHQSSHMLAALDSGQVIGFLRYVVQPIGPDENLSSFTFNGKVLLEAKVIAFGVTPDRRRQGIGRTLQEKLIQLCLSQGVYQIRSHSSLKNVENHALKTALGFGIHPFNPENGKSGYYFILPLRPFLQDESLEDHG